MAACLTNYPDPIDPRVDLAEEDIVWHDRTFGAADCRTIHNLRRARRKGGNAVQLIGHSLLGSNGPTDFDTKIAKFGRVPALR